MRNEAMLSVMLLFSNIMILNTHSIALVTVDDYWWDSLDHLQLSGFQPDSPVIYDNEGDDDVACGHYLRTKASLGEINLVGCVSTQLDPHGDFYGEWAHQKWFDIHNVCADSGMCMDRIPYPARGQQNKMTRPTSGNIWDTAYTPSDGSNLYVQEALKASPQRRLLIYVGAQKNTIATAILQSGGSICNNIWVMGCGFDLGYNDGWNDGQKWAAHIVAKTCRVFAGGSGYGWDWPSRNSCSEWTYQPRCWDEWNMIPEVPYMSTTTNPYGLKWMVSVRPTHLPTSPAGAIMPGYECKTI